MKVITVPPMQWAMPAVAENLAIQDYKKKAVWIDCTTWMTMFISFERLFNSGYNWIAFGAVCIAKED